MSFSLIIAQLVNESSSVGHLAAMSWIDWAAIAIVSEMKILNKKNEIYSCLTKRSCIYICRVEVDSLSKL